jgi:hypothetical protein
MSVAHNNNKGKGIALKDILNDIKESNKGLAHKPRDEALASAVAAVEAAVEACDCMVCRRDDLREQVLQCQFYKEIRTLCAVCRSDLPVGLLDNSYELDCKHPQSFEGNCGLRCCSSKCLAVLHKDKDHSTLCDILKTGVHKLCNAQATEALVLLIQRNCDRACVCDRFIPMQLLMAECQLRLPTPDFDAARISS